MTTKNGDMPAMPFEAVMARSNGNTTGWTNYTGLTKREMMAMHILPSLIGAYDVDWVATQGEAVARDAVMYADLLLGELERTK